MKLLELFRGKKSDEQALNENPYLNARRTLNDHNGAIISSRQIWQATALLALLIAIGAVGGIIHIGSQSRFIPYVVEVDKLGQANAVKRADRAAEADGRILHATIAAFVRDARMVSFDRNVQNDAIWRVFSLLQSSDPATTKITEYMKDPATSPTKRAETHSVGVEISSVLQQTAETWEVNWMEKVWDRQGIRVEQYRMRGLVTVYGIPPTTATTEEEIRRNPLGIFVRDFTWSRIAEK
jgi:type IV secretion system protein VirB5